jgi:hypothetical protein
MSWVFGICGILNREFTGTVEKIFPKPLYSFEEKNLYIRAGGKNCVRTFIQSPLGNKDLLALGIGIKSGSGSYKFVKKDEWPLIVSDSEINKLNGHFVLIKWDEKQIEIFTDNTGLRDIYFAQTPDGNIVFSTRADWLVRAINARLNLKQFGSKWLLFNKISPESDFIGIDRVIGGGSVIINRFTNKIRINKKSIIPALNIGKLSDDEFHNILKNLVCFPLSEGYKVSLSLSGGMDSRVLFSILLNSKASLWNTHTFGNVNSSDSIIARRITSRFNIENIHIDEPLPDADKLLAELKEYVSATIISNEASAVLQLRNYSLINSPNTVIIDGGFGEIWRREFFNRLLFSGRNALISGDTEGIIRFLFYRRADVFSEEMTRIMLEGAKEQIENLNGLLPPVNLTGAENRADLMAINTRFINFYSNEQARLDSEIFCYMPFAQPDLVSRLFAVSLEQKENGKLLREVIRKNNKQLTKFLLARGEISHPFWFNPLMSRIWKAGAKKAGIRLYNDHRTENLLNALSAFILDTISSSDVKSCGFYDYNKLSVLSGELKKGALTPGAMRELDWWLSFEVFRQFNKLRA